MALLLSASLLATVATAQLTTSIWAPFADTNETFVGSVVSQQGDRTVLSLRSNATATTSRSYAGIEQDTVTVADLTYVAFGGYAIGATIDSAGFPTEGTEVVATATFECTRENSDAIATCATTERAIGTWKSIESDDVRTTSTMSGDYQQYYQEIANVVLTAGLEKLSASAATTPTGSTVKTHNSQSTTGSEPSSVESAEATQATGAAGPVRSLAPVLAGLGAAAAFFV